MSSFQATHEWFRTYKIPAGKPANEFAFDGQYKGAEYAHKVKISLSLSSSLSLSLSL